MPNGHVLAIVWEHKTEDDAIAAGRDPEAPPRRRAVARQDRRVRPVDGPGRLGVACLGSPRPGPRPLQAELRQDVKDRPDRIDLNYVLNDDVRGSRLEPPQRRRLQRGNSTRSCSARGRSASSGSSTTPRPPTRRPAPPVTCCSATATRGRTTTGGQACAVLPARRRLDRGRASAVRESSSLFSNGAPEIRGTSRPSTRSPPRLDPRRGVRPRRRTAGSGHDHRVYPQGRARAGSRRSCRARSDCRTATPSSRYGTSGTQAR